MNRYVVAITGASGMIYARELLAYFATRPDLELHAVISRAGEQVLNLELGISPDGFGAFRHVAPGGRLYFGAGQRLVSGSGHGGGAVFHGVVGSHLSGGGTQPDPPGR